MYDISSGLTSILSLLLRAFAFCFNYLDSFVFYGISLLDYIIGIIILGCAISILIGVARSGMNRSERYMKAEQSKAERRSR